MAADTGQTPIDLGSYSSRVTFMAGNACLEAARNLREKILPAVAGHWQVQAESLEMVSGRIVA